MAWALHNKLHSGKTSLIRVKSPVSTRSFANIGGKPTSIAENTSAIQGVSRPQWTGELAGTKAQLLWMSLMLDHGGLWLDLAGIVEHMTFAESGHQRRPQLMNRPTPPAIGSPGTFERRQS